MTHSELFALKRGEDSAMFSKRGLVLALLACVLGVSGCYQCDGPTKPCPAKKKPVTRCDLRTGPLGEDCHSGCAKYYQTTDSTSSYATQCWKAGPIVTPVQILPTDPNYKSCPTCDESQCAPVGYYTRTSKPCEEKLIGECFTYCEYGDFISGTPPTS